MATTSPTSQLDATLATLQGGLNKITDAASADLAGWLKTLHGNADLADVAQELQRLHDAIAHNQHGTIADSLSALSEQTKQAAVTATPDSQSRLYQLSDVLKQAAGQVGA
ncbi:hypothetical protein HHL22_17450 [Hymenobacter sp. RP-2-7]|uniref:DUF4404 family protein n=1 Tax=Hymenobacter polaris TaxID=2682546 RepID=A0A7Y0AH41_9BACT|nr:hypothetical protein [Hymenobacter polaris]NML66995.1 hypothetical protein [Hymenobacter polaris]